MYLEEYIKSLEKEISDKNEKIYMNRKIIKEKEGSEKKLKEKLFTKKLEKENINSKIGFLKDRLYGSAKKN